MAELPSSITLSIVVLTIFLIFIASLKYTTLDHFSRTRIIMTSFFLFIVATLTISFWQFFFQTLPYTIPAGFLGVFVGYLIGVRGAEERIKTEGVAHYTRHFAHIDVHRFEDLTWWTLFNYYSVVSALVLINLVGLTTVLLHNLEPMALATSAFGAFLIGSTIPYLVHIWSIRAKN